MSQSDPKVVRDLTNSKVVLAYMSRCRTRGDWNQRTSEVLAANGEVFPVWWSDVYDRLRTIRDSLLPSTGTFDG